MLTAALGSSRLGVPPFKTIKSKQRFITEAIAAYFLTSYSIADEDNESIVAVGVALSGMNHPTVVRRKNGIPSLARYTYHLQCQQFHKERLYRVPVEAQR